MFKFAQFAGYCSSRTSFFRSLVQNNKAICSNLVAMKSARRQYELLTKIVGGVSGGGALLFSLSLFNVKTDPKTTGSDHRLTAQDIETIASVTDILYKDYLIDRAYGMLNKYRNSEHSELLWRLARVICEKGKQAKDPNEKRKLFTEALEVAERALRFEPVGGNFGAHKWYAIILNYKSGMGDSKELITKSYEVKTHLERALELNAFDPTTWHILGIWHYEIASISSVKRLLARTLFAKPPESTYDEALRHFERAEALQPDFYSANHYYLGLTYDHLKKKDEALAHIKTAFTSPILTEDDKNTHEKAAEYLKKNYPAIYNQLQETQAPVTDL